MIISGYIFGAMLLWWIGLAQYYACFYEHQHLLECLTPDRLYDHTFHNMQVFFTFATTFAFLALFIYIFLYAP